MYCTKKMVDYFLKIGHPENEIPQLKEALKVCRTTILDTGKRISNQKAIEMLGLEVFLSGISRAAFHWDAGRQTPDGITIDIDCSKLFK